jgi:cysteinyl-tRNA synthetase
MLKLHNTLGNSTTEFTSILPGLVSMYNCGPTVYDRAHIGNLRSYVFADVLRRTLEWNKYEVTQIVNITDVGHLSGDEDNGEDKMTKALVREGLPLSRDAMKKVAIRYFDLFLEDLSSLNIKKATNYPFASDHIKEDIDMIEVLSQKGYTYTTSDGIYFDTAKYKEYGKLGGGVSDDSHARITANSEKKNYRDFALWKFNNSLGFEAPFGNGFPGWHIECSAMSIKYLGETFDIHTGGIDHIPVHHNNEIAQSESATGVPYAIFWLHNAHVLIDGSKMAKSEGTGVTIETLKKNGIHPLSYRFFLLQAKYSTQINFTLDSIVAAQNGFESLLRRIIDLQIKTTGSRQGNLIPEAVKAFADEINGDLNTPSSLAFIFDLVENQSHAPEDVLATVYECDKVLGLNLEEISKLLREIPEEIITLKEKRENAKKNRDFESADALRGQMAAAGFILKDTTDSTQIERTLTSLI